MYNRYLLKYSLLITSLFSAGAIAQQVNNPDIRCTVTGNGIATDTTAAYQRFRSSNANLGVVFTDWGYSNFGNPGILISLGGAGALNDISPNLEMRQPRPRSTTTPQTVDTIEISFVRSYNVITLGGVLPFPDPTRFPFSRRNPSPEQQALLSEAAEISFAHRTSISREELSEGFQSTVQVATYDATTRSVGSVSAVLSCAYTNTVALPVVEEPPCTLSSEARYSIRNVKSGRYLNIAGASTADRGNAIIWGESGDFDNSTFVAKNKDNGWFAFEALHSGRHLNIAGNTAQDGANLIQWGLTNDYANSQFRLYESDGACRIEARHSGKCLSTKNAGTGNGTNVEQQSCELGDEALWVLEMK